MCIRSRSAGVAKNSQRMTWQWDCWEEYLFGARIYHRKMPWQEITIVDVYRCHGSILLTYHDRCGRKDRSFMPLSHLPVPVMYLLLLRLLGMDYYTTFSTLVSILTVQYLVSINFAMQPTMLLYSHYSNIVVQQCNQLVRNYYKCYYFPRNIMNLSRQHLNY